MKIFKKPDFDYKCHENVFYNHLFKFISSVVLWIIVSISIKVLLSRVEQGDEVIKGIRLINACIIISVIALVIIVALSVFIRYIDGNVEYSKEKLKDVYKNWSIAFDIFTIVFFTRILLYLITCIGTLNKLKELL